MIPKIIHYCWFGGNELPEMAAKCIDSWKMYFPNYEIKEWNESNFDVNCCSYVKEAYEAKKWAFVSDFARFKILNEYGGIYFDTDVEVIAPLENIIEHGPFMGCEASTQATISGKEVVTKINPGLGMAATSNMHFLKQIIKEYENRHYIKQDGSQDITTIVETTTNLFENNGFDASRSKEIQNYCGFNLYPPDYFCPLDYCTGKVTKTENTRTIHWYSSTWFTQGQQAEKKIKQFTSKFGFASFFLERLITFPVRVWNKFQNIGFINTIKFAIGKMRHR